MRLQTGKRMTAFHMMAWLILIWCIPMSAHAQMRGSADVVKVDHQWSVTQIAPGTPGDKAILAVMLDIDPAWHLKPDKSQLKAQDEFLIATELEVVSLADGLTAESIRYPKARADIPVKLAGKPTVTTGYSGTAILYLPVRVSDSALPGEYAVDVKVTVQACDEASCLAPAFINVQAMLTVGAVTQPVTGDAAELFDAFDQSIVIGGQVNQPGTTADGLTVEAVSVGIITTLIFAFLGGVLLNVMPCVLPVIPIKILGLVQSTPDAGRRIRLGVAMFLGVLCFWVVLGVLIAGLSNVQGISVLFGYWWFNVGLGLFIVALAVGMCGLFSIGLPRWVYAINPRHDSYTGSFGFGVMTAVLATPCTGPFLGASAGAVLTTGPTAAFLTFLFIGLGMALPYLLLTMFPGLVDRIPRTGPASELVKQVLGLLMLSAGAFFIGAGVNSFFSDGSKSIYQWYWWATAGLIAIAGLWLTVRTISIAKTKWQLTSFATLGLLMSVAAVATAYEATRPSEIQWVYYTPQRFAQAIENDQVVMVDFTADWCINCIVLERTVLETGPVIGALASEDVIAMKVDLTGDNPDGWAKLNAADRVAIPLLVVFDRDGNEVFKQEVYTVKQVVRAIETARGDVVALD